MSYLGLQPSTTNFVVDAFSGDAVTTSFTMSRAPATKNSIAVFIDGVKQHVNTYSINGTSLDLTGAPPSGSNNIEVLHLGISASVGTPANGSVGQNQLDANLFTELSAGRRNLIINGDFSISQRGNFTSSTAMTNNVYYLDRWRAYINGVSSDLQVLTTSQPSSISGGQSARVTATSTGSGRVGMLQRYEHFSKLGNRTVTISCWMKSNSTNARIGIYDGVSEQYATAHTGGGSWEYITGTFSVATGVTVLEVISHLAHTTGGATSLTSGDYIEVTQVQLERGGNASTFEVRLPGEELRLCQRYYRRQTRGTSAENRTIVSGRIDSLGDFSGVLLLHPQMRVTPTLSHNAAITITDGSGGATGTASLGGASGPDQVRISIPASLTAGDGAEIELTTNGDWFELNSEL